MFAVEQKNPRHDETHRGNLQNHELGIVQRLLQVRNQVFLVFKAA